MRTLAAAGLGALVACAAAPELWLDALRSDAAPDGGALAADTALVLVWADSGEAAWRRIVRARTEEPLEESELLARTFEAASVGVVEVAVGGPHARLNEQVLVDAFQLCERNRLPGLRVIYVSPEPPGERLIEVFARHRAGWVHRSWRGDPPR